MGELLKKLWNMKVAIIEMVVGAFATFSKYQEMEGVGNKKSE